MNPGTLCTASAPGAISLALVFPPSFAASCLRRPASPQGLLNVTAEGKVQNKVEREVQRAPWLVTHRPSATHPHQVSARVPLTVGRSSSLAVADPGQLEPSPPNFTVLCCMSVTAGNLGSDHERQALAGVAAGVGTGLAPAVHRSSGQRQGSRVCSACSEPALTELCRKRGFSQTPRWVAGSVGFCVHLVF